MALLQKQGSSSQESEHASSSLYSGFGSGRDPKQNPQTKINTEIKTLPPPLVQVFGSAAIDITTRPSIPLEPRTTTPGSIILTPGGVGRNIAEAAQALLPDHSVQLVSPIGSSPSPSFTESELDTGEIDGFGKVLISEMDAAGMRTDGLLPSLKGRTAGCTLSLGMEGDLNDGVADMGIVEELTPEVVSLSRKTLGCAAT
jgi:pseudouridine-5'-phosphate glycosidase/pseudouridine kinase